MNSESSSQTLTEPDQISKPTKPAHWRVVASHSLLTPEVLAHKYAGAGTDEDPYVVEFIPHDPRNPMGFSQLKKWSITLLVAFATLAVSFVSSAYVGGINQLMAEFNVGTEVAVLGVSLFVLGFAIGPLMWGPLSEMYGRQILFIGTYGALTAFNAGTAGSQNIETVLLLRFFAGAFGSSPLTNAGGVIADIFPANQRGLAMAVFSAAPFMGPVLGPIAGGFLGETKGWRWVEGLLAIFSGCLWLLGTFTIPETYPPVLLRKRAAALSKATGQIYRSKLALSPSAQPSLIQAFKTALSRPWVLLFREPIVAMLSVYMAIIYGSLYMMFASFPIVYQQQRGWSPGIGGLAFLGVAFGMLVAVGYTFWDNARYIRVEAKARAGGARGAPPEARLPPTIIGSLCLPIGLFWFAWTNGLEIHWIVSIIATAPFGFGMVMVFLSIMNYLIDSYTIYAASVLAANSVLRSLFGAAFPLFTTQMYDRLGIHWASSIPAFLALACVPFPLLFYKYGATIRMKCKFAREAEEAMAKIQGAQEKSEEEKTEKGSVSVADPETEAEEKQAEKDIEVDLEKGRV